MQHVTLCRIINLTGILSHELLNEKLILSFKKINLFPLQITNTVSTQSKSYFSLPTTEPISIRKLFTT